MAKDCLSATADIHKETRVSQLEKYTLIQSDPREVLVLPLSRGKSAAWKWKHTKREKKYINPVFNFV